MDMPMSVSASIALSDTCFHVQGSQTSHPTAVIRGNVAIAFLTSATSGLGRDSKKGCSTTKLHIGSSPQTCCHWTISASTSTCASAHVSPFTTIAVSSGTRSLLLATETRPSSGPKPHFEAHFLHRRTRAAAASTDSASVMDPNSARTEAAAASTTQAPTTSASPQFGASKTSDHRIHQATFAATSTLHDQPVTLLWKDIPINNTHQIGQKVPRNDPRALGTLSGTNRSVHTRSRHCPTRSNHVVSTPARNIHLFSAINAKKWNQLSRRETRSTGVGIALCLFTPFTFRDRGKVRGLSPCTNAS